MTAQGHVPVLLEEALDYLNIQREGTYVDCTLGLAGHALEILKLNPKAEIIGIDLDELSLKEARKKLVPYAGRVKLYLADFRTLPDFELDFAAVRGVLVDLGISSFQLDSPERGFSFNQDGPLDMRLDLRNKTTAGKILEKYPEHRLATLFEEYGELQQTRRLAREIATRRKLRRLETTAQLRAIVEEVYRWRPQKGKIHPAAKVFQALRIEVNQELKGLGEFLEETVAKVGAGTRFVAISFHSLEDRIIKHTFVDLASDHDRTPSLKILTKKPVGPSEQEMFRNSRSRSAKMRAAERI